TPVTATPVSRTCSCCATSLGDRPINLRRSWSIVKRTEGVLSVQSVLTSRVCGLARMISTTFWEVSRNLLRSGPMTRNATGKGEGGPNACLRRESLYDLLANTQFQGVAGFRTRCQHDDLRERRIRQFRIIG